MKVIQYWFYGTLTSLNPYSGLFTSGLLLLLASFIFRLFATTIFQEDFSNPKDSYLHWMVVAEGSDSISIKDSQAKLENSSKIYSAFALHSLPASSNRFNYSGMISSNGLGSGLFCCTDKSSGTLKGYAIVAGDGELVLFHFDGGNPVTLFRHATGFLDEVKNRLTLSSDGERLTVFCNGFFQFSFPDTLGIPQDIAVLTPPQSKVAFDDISFTTIPADTFLFPDFFDSMKVVSDIWQITGNGEMYPTIDGMNVVTEKNRMWQAGIPLPVKNFNVVLQIMPFFGNLNKVAGIFIGKQDTGNSGTLLQKERFGITPCGNFIVQTVLENGNIAEMEKSAIELKLDEWNKLDLSRMDGIITVSINDKEVYRTATIDTADYGVGLFVDDSLSIELKNFQLTCPLPAVAVGSRTVHIEKNKRPQFRFTADLLGRVIPTAPFTMPLQRHCPVPGVYITENEKKIRGL